MKKIIYVFLIILMLCSCNNNTDVKPDRGKKTSIPFSYIDGLQETSYIELYMKAIVIQIVTPLHMKERLIQ